MRRRGAQAHRERVLERFRPDRTLQHRLRPEVSGSLFRPLPPRIRQRGRQAGRAHYSTMTYSPLNAYRWPVVRTYSLPSSSAGVAKIGSPRSFLASTSSLSPALMTVTTPSPDDK